MQKLLVSVRGPIEAVEACKGGAHIADVEYPFSALGTSYPLNIFSVKQRLAGTVYKKILVSTNIGEKQSNRGTACQSAVGVAIAGADLVKCGLAGLDLKEAIYLGELIVRSVKKFTKNKKIYPAVFVDDEQFEVFNPFKDGIKLIEKIKADGLLIDTYDKEIGKGLLDYCSLTDIKNFVKKCHSINKEAWIAGSINIDQLPSIWKTNVDVVCVRGAACEVSEKGRAGDVKQKIVKELIKTIP